jgi:iron complex transport system ATP-binding protein
MIRVDSVEFAYGERKVLRGVSLEARAGQLYGILGPNGSGKTTLVRLVLGLLAPHAGNVRVADRAVADYSRREFARAVAAVPQEMPIDFPFTVRELVLLGRTPHLGPLGFEAASDLAAAEEAMTLCGVGELGDRPIFALSGGELRRAYIARAIAQKARALVCDEPTSGLDIHHQVAVFELLRSRSRAGDCVIAVVHDLNLAAAYCDRLMLLREGKTVAEGTVGDVLTYRRVREAYDVEVYVGVNEITGARFLIPMGPR